MYSRGDDVAGTLVCAVVALEVLHLLYLLHWQPYNTKPRIGDYAFYIITDYL